ncbi:MAG TPA: hypothetical protein VGG27_13470 [Magnetospirillaceae bacterium]
MKRIFIALLGIFWSGAALANSCPSYPYPLTNGTTADGSQVMANFNTIRDCASFFVGGTTAGTAAVQVLSTVTPNVFSLSNGNRITFVAGFSSSGPTTLNIASTSSVNILRKTNLGLVPLNFGDMSAGQVYTVQYDGTQYELLDPDNGYVLPPGALSPPGGRLTLQSGSPVQTTDQSASSTIYYDTYASNTVPVISGTGAIVYLPIAANEISVGLSATQILASSAYDIWAFSNSGTLAICVGPAWTSLTTRSATTAVASVLGLWVNNAAMNSTCWGGPSGSTAYSIAANQATLLGSFQTAGTAGVTYMVLNGSLLNGGAQILLSNAYNRVPVFSTVPAQTASWTYGSPGWRLTNGGGQLTTTVFDTLAQGFIKATYSINAAGSSTSVLCSVGVSRYTMGSSAGIPLYASTLANAVAGAGSSPLIITENFYPTLGDSVFGATESASAATCSFSNTLNGVANGVLVVETTN